MTLSLSLESPHPNGKTNWKRIQMAILTAMAFILVACIPAPTAEPISAATGAADPEETWTDLDPSGQSIDFWHPYTNASGSALNKIVDDFNQMNEWGITVQAKYQGSYGDILYEMQGVMNTSRVPDLVTAYPDQAATYQLANGLLDMRPLVKDKKWGLLEADQDDFFPSLWNQDIFPAFDNARLGFPFSRSMVVMYYNMDWLKELGYDAPPTTPDQFKEMACKAVKTPYGKSTTQGSMGYELSVDASSFTTWALAFGGDVFDYAAGQFVYNSEANQKAMIFLQSLFKDGCAAVVDRSYGDQTDFAAGKLLFSIDLSSGLTFYDRAVREGAAFNWSVAAIPHTTPNPVMNINEASIVIPKTSLEKELAAWLFLKYFISPDVQAEWAMASGYLPARKNAITYMPDYFGQNQPYRTTFDLLTYGKFEPPVPGYDFVGEKVGEALTAILQGGDVKTSLDGLNSVANTILAEQY
jgi:multiple sugar transport system substrate-binding protein